LTRGCLHQHRRQLFPSPLLLTLLPLLSPLLSPPFLTEASDPLAAALENVPYVPLLARTPKAALVDLVVFANGQTGKDNPQRQGLSSALKDNLGPLNIAANTPASPAYSPLWAVNLAKWLGPPGGVGGVSHSAVAGMSRCALYEACG
jgi:hypothetical protein